LIPIDKIEKIGYNKSSRIGFKPLLITPKPLSTAIDKGFLRSLYIEHRGAELFLSAACREPAWFFRAVLTTSDSIKPAVNTFIKNI